MAGAVSAGLGTGRLGAFHLSCIQPGLLSEKKRVAGRSFIAGHCGLQWRTWRDEEHCRVCTEKRRRNNQDFNIGMYSAAHVCYNILGERP